MEERAELFDTSVSESEWGIPEKLNLRCTRCGYGALRASAPERCPMCHAVDAWIHAPSRFSAAAPSR